MAEIVDGNSRNSLNANFPAYVNLIKLLLRTFSEKH